MKRAPEIDLLNDYFARQLNTSQKEKVEERRNLDPEFSEEFDRLKMLHRFGERQTNLSTIRAIATQVARDETDSTTFRDRAVQWARQNPLKIAASIALLLLLGFLALRNSGEVDSRTIVGNDSVKVKIPTPVPLKNEQHAIHHLDSGKPNESPKPKEELHSPKPIPAPMPRNPQQLVNHDPNQEAVDGHHWQRTIEQNDPIAWLEARGFAVPEGIPGKTWRGVAKMVEVKVGLINIENPDQVDSLVGVRIVVLQNPDLPAPEYYFDKDLYLFIAHDPVNIQLGDVQLFSLNTGSNKMIFLKMEGRLYQLLREGKESGLSPLEEEKREEYLNMFTPK